MENNIRFVLGAAMVGIFLGVAGLIFGIVSKNKADELRREFAQVQELVEKIQRVEESSSGITASATRLNREVESLRQGTQAALDKVSAELTRFRQDLNSNIVAARSLEEKLGDIERVRVVAAPPPPAPAPAATAQPTAIPAASPAPAGVVMASLGGEETFYTIRTGDTFSRIAANHNVSLSALMQANPEVDERRLQVGQKVRIPSH
jgi:LysM repeat protein